MDMFGGAAILIDEPHEVEVRGDHIHIIDKCGIRRAMPRAVALRYFARLAERLRNERTAEIIPFEAAANH